MKLPPDIFAQMKRVQIVTRRLADTSVTGRYRSAFRGQGIEFEEFREYYPGDDIRAIDWKVTARIGRPYVKSYREERERSIVIASDVSASTHAGLSSRSRALTIAHIGAFLALLARQGNDRVGLAIFSDRVPLFLPPRKVRSQVWRIVHEALRPRSGEGRTSIANLSQFLSKNVRRRSVIFIISDFIDSGFERELAILSRKHEVIAVRIEDPVSLELPSVGLVEFLDPETGQLVTVDTSLAGARKKYSEQAELMRKRQYGSLRSIGVDVIDVSTERPFVGAFRRYFEERVHYGA